MRTLKCSSRTIPVDPVTVTIRSASRAASSIGWTRNPSRRASSARTGSISVTTTSASETPQPGALRPCRTIRNRRPRTPLPAIRRLVADEHTLERRLARAVAVVEQVLHVGVVHVDRGEEELPGPLERPETGHPGGRLLGRTADTAAAPARACEARATRSAPSSTITSGSASRSCRDSRAVLRDRLALARRTSPRPPRGPRRRRLSSVESGLLAANRTSAPPAFRASASAQVFASTCRTAEIVETSRTAATVSNRRRIPSRTGMWDRAHSIFKPTALEVPHHR